MVNLALAAALAAASPQGATPADADPAIFQVRDGDTTVYIFGTFHALDGRPDWFNDGVRSAFDQSSELVLETLIPDAPPVTYHQPTFTAPRVRFDGPSVTPSASFLGTTRMAINAGRTQGMSVGNGADMVLRRAADDAGKQVTALETLQSQLDMFSRMPAPPRAQAPRRGSAAQAAETTDGVAKAMAQMQAAWKRGDQAVFVSMLDQLRRGSPETYRMMFTDRNSRWADWIAGRMQTPGTVFVAVGAGHLVGSDSLLVRLAQLGIESTRVD